MKGANYEMFALLGIETKVSYTSWRNPEIM